MEIKQRTANDAVIVGFTGEVDMSSSPDARRAFLQLIEKKTKKIVADLSLVTYIDSSGLATLVECLQNMRKYGGQLRLLINDNIKDVFSLARLDTIFDIRKSEQDALS
jgi:anti-sigma B factor antagonist